MPLRNQGDHRQYQLEWKEKEREIEKILEMPGIEPGASHMRSERSTTELHPQHVPKGSLV